MSIVNAGFMAGGGEMGGRIRSFDWSETAIGPIETWPQSLRTILSVILNSKIPMILYWGPELNCFYNDAFRPSLGKDGKHPGSLGKPGSEFWAEAWHELQPVIAGVKAGGEATWSEDQLIPIYRNGKLENVYWTYSFSPVFDESGAAGGVLVTGIETTRKVLSLVQLEESADELSFAIEATELATWDVNPLTNKLKGNARLKNWFGLGADEEVDLRTAVDVIVEDDKARVIEAIERAYQYDSGGQYDIEYTIINPLTEQERYVRAKGRAWFNQHREAYRFNGTLQDITAKVLARRKTEESEQKIRAMIEAAPFPIAVYAGRDMKVQMANQAVFDAWGKGNNVLGKKLADVLPELGNQQILALLDQVFTTGIAYSEKNQKVELVVDNELKLFYFNNNFTPLFDNAGHVYGIMNTAANVTDLILAQQKLEESEQRFRIMADAAPNIIWALNPDTSIKYANKFMLEFIDTSMEKLLASNWEFIIHPQDLELTRQTVETAFKERKKYRMEHRFLRYDGEYRRMLSQGAPSYFANGDLYGYVGSSFDITEIKEVELKLQNLAEELAAANEELRTSSNQLQETNQMLSSSNQKLSHINADMDNFIYTVSHDLRAPISNIEGLMLAIQRYLPEESRQNPMIEKLFGLVTDSIERFKRTINDLTEITKVQREDGSDEVARVDLSEIIREVQLDLSPQIEQAEANFEIDLQACSSVSFSAKNARSIVYNLISNAVKYRSADRPLRVHIYCYLEGDYLVLQVQDNGLGMDLSDKSKIFAMFKRLHDHVEGTGVGLYIVKKIIENAGGKIEVESKVGQGTTFRVYFRQSIYSYPTKESENHE